MAILISFKLPGDPPALLTARGQSFGRQIRDIAVQNGQLGQVIVDEGDGLRLFYLWESEAGMHRASQQIGRLADAAEAIQQEWRQWDVLHHDINASEGDSPWAG